MMGFRQVYKAAGLEHYQDKIQLSKDQRKTVDRESFRADNFY